MMRKKSPKGEKTAVAKRRSDDGLSGRKRKRFLMRKTWISLERQIPNGSGKRLHRLVVPEMWLVP
jgi:hypothetical protein